jgi:hypothetical protein
MQEDLRQLIKALLNKQLAYSKKISKPNSPSIRDSKMSMFKQTKENHIKKFPKLSGLSIVDELPNNTKIKNLLSKLTSPEQNDETFGLSEANSFFYDKKNSIDLPDILNKNENEDVDSNRISESFLCISGNQSKKV